LNRLGNMEIPNGCMFNTFGFGEDHDSKLLHSISLKTQGVYYYVPSRDYVHKIFGGCVHAILTSRARLVKIKLEAQDGSRIITLATPFQITQKKVAKEYEVDLGILYSGEFKSILFRLSLRKMDAILNNHSLLRFNVEYVDIYTGSLESFQTEVFVERPVSNIHRTIPENLDINLNRYQAAKTIIESVEMASNLNFVDAQKKLDDCCKSIRSSPSGNTEFCRSLIEDLRDCEDGMSDVTQFQSGVHSAHAIANMHFMQRSSGFEIIKQKKLHSMENNNGYLTDYQLKGQQKIVKKILSIVDKYTHNY